jgi:hypothetical protein
LAEREKFVLMGEERVVVVVGFAEAVAGIEHDAAAVDACGEGLIQRAGEAGLHQRNDFFLGEKGLCTPIGWAAASVHEHDAAA